VFTSTAGQTTFTVTNGYNLGMLDVFVNGVKFVNGVDYTATDGTTVVLTDALTASQIVEIDNYLTAFLPTNALRTITTFTATAGQTTFSVTYTQGLIDVYYNGSCLAQSEYTAINGTSIILATACQVNDIVVVYAYSYSVGAFSGIGGSGTTNFHPKFTGTNTIGNSLIFDNGTNLGLNNTNPFGGATSLTGMAISDRGGLFKLAINDVMYLSNNLYYDGTNWKRVTANGGTFMQLESTDGGTLRIFAAATGTAGSNATTIDRFMLSTSGNFGLGTTTGTSYFKLNVDGHAVHLPNNYATDGANDPYRAGVGWQSFANPGVVLSTLFTTINDGNYGGHFVWLSRGTNGGNLGERMRLTSGGVLAIGSNGTPASAKVYVEQDISNGNGILIRTPTDSGSWGYLRFMNSGFLNIGGVFQTSSTTLQYATSSDYRLKEDLKDFNGLDKVSAIKVYDFKWKESEDRMEGVLAHELQEVIPYAVNGEKDALDEDGNIRTQGVDYSLIVPTLIKAIQELKAEVEQLKQK
jgi:hypothetical protein